MREHDGRQEFWTGKTWLFFPADAPITKVSKFLDGFYLDKLEGLPYRRKATFWYYWSRAHLDWKWCEGMSDDTLEVENMERIGKLDN